MSHPEFWLTQSSGFLFMSKVLKKKEPLINLGISPHQKNKRIYV